jgi:hypothetical protein
MDVNGSSLYAQQLISACALVISQGVGLASSDMIRLLTERNVSLLENGCRRRSRQFNRHQKITLPENVRYVSEWPAISLCAVTTVHLARNEKHTVLRSALQLFAKPRYDGMLGIC